MPTEDGTTNNTNNQPPQQPDPQPMQGNSTPPPNDTQTDGEMPSPEPLDFETWLDEQDEAVQTLITTHTTALKNALDSERKQRKDLASQLREATEALEEGSEAKKSLEKISIELDITNQRADFYEEAVKPSVGLKNPKLGWLAVQQDNLLEEFTRRGKVDYPALFTYLKENYLELFAQPIYPTPPANAGAGIGQQGGNLPLDMNQLIRRKAGIRIT